MKTEAGLALLAACVVSMLGVGALMLYQKGLLSTKTLQLFLAKEQAKSEVQAPPPAPIGLAASVQEKEQHLERRYQEAQEFDEKLRLQKQELEFEKAKIDEQLRMLRQKPEPEHEAAVAEAQDMAELVKIYEGMEAEGTASIMEHLSNDIGAEILLQMRRRQASRVMESLSTPKAVAISSEILPDKIAKNN